MTKEEAIEEIKRWTPILLNSGQCTEKTSEAQDMAISALKGFEGMTNGEVMEAVFPNCYMGIDNDGWVVTNIDESTPFQRKWWNAPYQKGGEE